ncbi:MMPL family transporter [Ulvibacterium marinum]|uniref:Glycerol acyltransferase n=1 Tax=Ulvibacterium marinum TaxID=2419782 RepID=A0A3B0CBU9_9FLAO|nr:MMPL family transporter [Ulvibacterium marinum]RKN82410.1 glycerol acyltransferase [Ulvibacterium marinum]
MDSFFYRTYQFFLRRKWLGLIVVLLFLLGLSVLVAKIKFEEDITKLIPVNSENEAYQRVLKTLQFTDKVIVNVKLDSDGSVDDLTQYASQFLDSLQANIQGYVKNVQGKVADDEVLRTMDFVYENLPLFLDNADYTTIRQKIKKDSIATLTKENYKTLISPSGIVAKKNILRDPLGLSYIALKKLRQLGIADGFTLKDGFLLSEDRQNILLFITPIHASNQTSENEPFAKELYRIQKQLNLAFDSKVKSEYFGAPLIAVANAQQIKRDIQFTVGIALTLLLILLIFFYRKLTLPIILFLPTIFGGLLSVALLYFIRKEISAISLGIGAVLLGITLDYSLHILTHIRNKGSIKSLYSDVAPSILMSSLTTASAFLCLLFLESQALQDLGIFAAVSVLGASVFALFFIPQAYGAKSAERKSTTFLDTLAAYNFQQNKWLIGSLVGLFVISIFTYTSVTFNKDIAKLNYEPPSLIDARKHLETLTDLGAKSLYITNYGNSQEEVLQASDSVYTLLNRLNDEKRILGFSAIGALIHSKKEQEEKIGLWKEFWKDSIGFVTTSLIDAGREYGFKPKTFDRFYELLQSDFKALEIEDYNLVNSFSVDDYLSTKDGFTTVSSLVKVDSSQIGHVRETFAKNPRTVLIDRQGMNETFLGNLKNDFNRLIGYSVLAILILLFIFFRSLSLTLVTSIPIFLTWFLTIGIMGLLQLEFNIFNIIISTFIFGLGVDYSIFMTNGLLTEYRTGEKALSTHRTSIILSVVTTILGVGVLIFAKHPALYTISVVSLIGILSAVLVAFTVQPMIFRLFIGSSEKRPISLRYLIHSSLSFGYFGLGGLVFSLYAAVVSTLFPKSRAKKQLRFHKAVSLLMKSVLYTNPFVSKKVIDLYYETFEKPAMIIANHTSFLDILAIGMLNPKIIFLVNDWVYNSPIFGNAAKLVGAYPVSSGLENGEDYLRKKVDQGFSLITFPEGTRSHTNKVRRFHKGAFYLAEKLGLDILPVLIHGNSEVLPKGSFIIRDGSITLKILPRIKVKDSNFGVNYTQRTKNISTHFKDQFFAFRKEIEQETYFHRSVLDQYRFKGRKLYKKVQEDLKKNASVYGQLLNLLEKKTKITHLSKDHGQLDFLLALDSTDRKINVYLEDKTTRPIVQNSFITHNRRNIQVASTPADAMTKEAQVLLLDQNPTDWGRIQKIIDEIGILLVLKNGMNLPLKNITEAGFTISVQNDNFIIAKR